MKRKFKIRNENLDFEMTNKTIFDIDEKFDNFGNEINGVMYGQNVYNNALKVMVCSCISNRLDEDKNENPLTIDELKEKLTPGQVVNEIVTFACDLYYDYRGVIRSTENEKDTNENIEEQSKKIDFSEKSFDINRLFLLQKHNQILQDKSSSIAH